MYTLVKLKTSIKIGHLGMSKKHLINIPKSCAVLFTVEFKDLLMYECHTLHTIGH